MQETRKTLAENETMKLQLEDLSRKLGDAKAVLRSACSLLSEGEVGQAQMEIAFYVAGNP